MGVNSESDRGGQLRELRATLAANRPQLQQIRLGACQRAELDHRFTLDRDRIGIVGLEQQRLVGHPDGLAEQPLLVGHSSQIDERPAVTRIGCERRFERILGLLELAGGEQGFTLMLERHRLLRDLVVRPLSRDRCRQGESCETYRKHRSKKAHSILSTFPAALAWTTEPRDEKPVRSVLPRRQ